MNDPLRVPKEKRRLRELPINRLFPNIMTLLALCFGLTAVRYALDMRWELAVTLILVASVLDGLDGRLARLLKVTSAFGAQLDSLADFFNFGVAPAIVVYLWSMHQIKAVGWGVALFFAICGALRLARFNTMLIEEEEEDDDEIHDSRKERFFVGVPAPAGAGLAVLPMVISFEIGDEIVRNPQLTIPWMMLVAVLMASRLPTISLKKMTIRHEYALPVMVCITAFIVMLISVPWVTLIAAGIGYLALLPIGWLMYYRADRSPRVELEEEL